MKLDHAADLYAAGKSFEEAAATVGLNGEVVRKALHRRGIQARTNLGRPSPKRRPADPEAIEAHRGGESVLSIARRLGVARGVVVRWLTEAGIQPRNGSEASKIRMGRMTADERRALAANAHEAIRNSERTEEHQIRIAEGRERAGHEAWASPGTDLLSMLMTERGIAHKREKAVGRYNVDIGLLALPIAVEILGGYWHLDKAVHAKRTPYILDRGWHIVFVWNICRFPIEPGALDYIVAFAEEAGRNPAARREYRMIRGDGQLIVAGTKDDEFTLIPPTERLLGSRAGD